MPRSLLLWLVLPIARTHVVCVGLTTQLLRPYCSRAARHRGIIASNPGHVFVVRGDLRQLAVDAMLMPTPSVLNRKWFPDGPPPGAIAISRECFTVQRRVHMLRGIVATDPQRWLSMVDGRFAAPEAIDPATGRPGLDWYIVAAEQFLREASTQLLAGGSNDAPGNGLGCGPSAGPSVGPGASPSASPKPMTGAATPPRFGRHHHLLALPVIGTGRGGARTASGLMIARLLSLLQRFAEEQPLVDVALVVKSRHMFSAAQAYRSQRAEFTPSWSVLLGTRLCETSAKLAALSRCEQLALFLGAGVSVSAGLPAWQQLITALAERDDVPMSPEEARQLSKLEMPDQASVLTFRLERERWRRGVATAFRGEGAQPKHAALAPARLRQQRRALLVHEGPGVRPRDSEPGSAGSRRWERLAGREEPVGWASLSALEQPPQLLTKILPPKCSEAEQARDSGSARSPKREGWLQRLVVSELGAKCEHALSHALLAGLPVSAVVTTNYDQLFESAWRAAKADFNVLPYETQPAEKYILKLHGDLRQPGDIVLTRGQMRDLLEQRKALTGILQTMLVTKHLLFVGFSLKDPNFGEVAGTVRLALRGQGGVSEAVAAAAICTPTDEWRPGGKSNSSTAMHFGTMLSLHNRPFLSELWPDIHCAPMDLTDATRREALSSAEASRLLDIFLDKLSLDASGTSNHLLDSDFGGILKPSEQALRETLIEFERRLQRNPQVCDSRGHAVVEETLQKLGLVVKREVRTVFALFSADRLDNTIDSQELQGLFRQADLAMDMSETRTIFKRHDQDADGRLSLSEFARLWERLRGYQRQALVAVAHARGGRCQRSFGCT